MCTASLRKSAEPEWDKYHFDGTELWLLSRRALHRLAKRGRPPWLGRRLGAFAQRGRAHCAYWAMWRELFGRFRAKRAILWLHATVASGRRSERINSTQAVSR